MRLHTTLRVCLGLTTIIALCLLGTGCSSSDDSDASGGSGGSGGFEPGCSSAPNCGSCSDCYTTCVCTTGDTSSCVAQCSGSGGNAGSGSGGTSGSGGSAGAPAYETFTIKTSPRAVGQGEEAFFCQNLTNPFGKDVEVIESESFMTPGSHHMFVFYEPGATDGAVHDCSGLEFQRYVHTAQTPQAKVSYPPGVGRLVRANEGFRVMAHYLNTTGAAIDAEITVVFKVVPAGSMQHQAGSIFLNKLGIYVPPNSPGTATASCNLPHDIQLINVASHMHQYAKHFVATASSGEKLYETTDWDEPEPTVYDPPLALAGGTKITWTCQYENTTGSALTFGDSAKTNEMCILSGTFFPAPDGDGINCQTP